MSCIMGLAVIIPVGTDVALCVCFVFPPVCVGDQFGRMVGNYVPRSGRSQLLGLHILCDFNCGKGDDEGARRDRKSISALVRICFLFDFPLDGCLANMSCAV